MPNQIFLFEFLFELIVSVDWYNGNGSSKFVFFFCFVLFYSLPQLKHNQNFSKQKKSKTTKTKIQFFLLSSFFLYSRIVPQFIKIYTSVYWLLKCLFGWVTFKMSRACCAVLQQHSCIVHFCAPLVGYFWKVSKRILTVNILLLVTNYWYCLSEEREREKRGA